MTVKTLIVIMMLGCFVVCSSAVKDETTPPRIVAMKGGTSFGHCRGYCRKEVQLKNTEVLFIVSSQDKARFPDKKVGGRITEQEWSSILQLTNTDAFKRLPDVVGCPDCADGGAEWVEISFNKGETKRVTYEYGKPPEEIKALAEKLGLMIKRYSGKVGRVAG